MLLPPSGRKVGKRSLRTRLNLEGLELRIVPSSNPAEDVLMFHNTISDSGVQNDETLLTPATVQVGSFGKIAGVSLDGEDYAQPLVVNDVQITTGPYQGVRDVIYIATENDTLYAIDADDPGMTGIVLWERSFTDINDPTDNTLGATSIAPVNSANIQSFDINPQVGITSTPVVDISANALYLIACTQEVVNGVTTFVQRLHAVSLSNGTDITRAIHDRVYLNNC